ncbi:MAG: hypothetical protein WDN69_07085 [Aliidongia sp.]
MVLHGCREELPRGMIGLVHSGIEIGGVNRRHREKRENGDLQNEYKDRLPE